MRQPKLRPSINLSPSRCMYCQVVIKYGTNRRGYSKVCTKCDTGTRRQDKRMFTRI